MSIFFSPAINMIGRGCINDAIDHISSLGFKKALVVTDKDLVDIGMVDIVSNLFNSKNIKTVIFDGVKPNPNIKNVESGLMVLKENDCDFVISLGGGSPHDCAKGIALVATNGGEIKDYEGVDKSSKPQLPLIAINTTAGTASEITRFCIITDDERHVKMAILDKNTTPLLSVNDSDLMEGMPKSLTAATGMDALTHAIEAYVSTNATILTDTMAIKAIKIIKENLPLVVEDGHNKEAREAMAYAQWMAGFAFNNASLGYVHAMAHQLGGLLDLPHGLCNAVLLPYVQEFNSNVAAKKIRCVGEALGVKSNGMTDEEGANEAIKAIISLSNKVGTNKKLSELGVKEEHIPELSRNTLKDACGFTNPIQASQEEIEELFRKAL